MKKFAIVIILFLIVLSGVKNETEFSLLNYFSGEYIVYTSQGEDENSVNLGFCYVNSKPVDDHIIGESMTIENLEVGAALQSLNARVVKTEYLEDGTVVIYAYSSLINDEVNVFGKQVNLQIATKNERTIIGWPLILGSF